MTVKINESGKSIKKTWSVFFFEESGTLQLYYFFYVPSLGKTFDKNVYIAKKIRKYDKSIASVKQFSGKFDSRNNKVGTQFYRRI